MSDLNYPLSIEDGSLSLVRDESDRALSQTRHLLATIAGERFVYSDFGVPTDILYDSAIPELATERMRLAIAQIKDIASDVSIVKYSDGVLWLQIILKSASVGDISGLLWQATPLALAYSGASTASTASATLGIVDAGNQLYSEEITIPLTPANTDVTIKSKNIKKIIDVRYVFPSDLVGYIRINSALIAAQSVTINASLELRDSRIILIGNI